MIKKIKRRQSSCKFQNQLKETVKAIRKCNDILVLADKTVNYYRMSPKEYDKVVMKEIQKGYKIDRDNSIRDVNVQAARIAKKLEIDNRVTQIRRSEAIITVKDHKENWQARPSFRLINPTKPDLGKVSKQILESKVKYIRNKLNMQQWVSTDAMLNWWSNVKDKRNKKIMKADIKAFYPNISEKLFLDAREWAKQYIEITEDEIELMLNTHLSFLTYNGKVWIKKEGLGFDTTMGSFDGAESCEIIGLFLLSKIKEVVKEAGIYRDDLVIIDRFSRKQWEDIRKRLIKLFKDHGLGLICELETNVADFLDVVIDIKNDVTKPFKKPNNMLRYVNVDSNHPKNVIKALPLQ